MVNIKDFLTEETEKIYNEVIDIVKFLESVTKININIFGGFIRDIICHYYNPTEEFKYSDIDIWLMHGRISLNSWKYRVENIVEKIKEKYSKIEEFGTYCYTFSARDNYGLLKIIINDIKFDISTNINYDSLFNNLCDFSVNNLYINSDGEIFTRTETKYNVNETIVHVKEKKIYDILNKDILEKKYINCDTELYSEDYYNIRLKQRKIKLIYDDYLLIE